jgi:hypothetical protein
MRGSFSLVGGALLNRVLVRRLQAGARPDWLLEVLAGQIMLPLARLVEMPDKRILADCLGGQLEILHLVQLGARRPVRGIGVGVCA